MDNATSSMMMKTGCPFFRTLIIPPPFSGMKYFKSSEEYAG